MYRTHPLIIENAVKFQSKASQELFPSKGPVKNQVVGSPTPEKENKQTCKRFHELSTHRRDARIFR